MGDADDFDPREAPRARTWWLTFAAGPVAGAVLWWLARPGGANGAGLAEGAGGDGMFSPEGAIVLGLLAWMAIWWATQAVELAATALLPVVVLTLVGAVPPDEVLAPYANDIIFLFGGGCVLGLAIERHGLAQRLLSLVLAVVGRSPGRVVAALLLVSAMVSAWVSNTATTVMLLPIAMAALAMYSQGVDREGPAGASLANFEKASVLAVGYGATIGGVITILGSPPNPIAVDWLRDNGTAMTFVGWARVGLPAAILMMIVAQLIFRWMLPTKGLPAPLRQPQRVHAPLTRGAWITIVVFLLAASAWILGPLVKELVPALSLSDGMIAVAAGLVLLVVPAHRGSGTPVVPWSMAARMPWGVFILVGGGLSLANAMQSTGVSSAVAHAMEGIGSMPALLVVLGVVAALVFASELASNAALTATAVPIVGAMAPGLGVPPEKLVVASALAASMAFMLPVGTPPNAIIYATGKLPVRDMMRLGFLLNLASIGIVTLVCWLLA